MFGMVLIVPMAFIIWNNNRLGFIRQFGILLVSTVVSFFVFALMFYGGQFGSLFGFMGEHAAGIYGFPEVISSPVKFVEHLISFGRESRMFFFSPFLLILIYLSLTIIILDWKIIKTQRNNELLFCLGWLASGYLFLMLFNYRPLRYQLYLLMPTAGIIGYLISYYKNIKIDFEPNYKNIGLLFLLWWSFFSHIIFIVGVYFLDLTLSAIVVWYALPLAILTIIILYFIKKTFVGIFNKVPSYLLIVLGLMILFQSISVYKWFNKRTYNLYEAGQSLAYDIAEDAILIGPYAHALTIDNNIKSFIYWFGMAQKEPRLFADFPVTHITADLSNWNELFKEYPFLKGSIHWVSNYRIRNIETRVARMPDDYMATYHPNYRQTDYERGIKYFHLANVDSTIFYLGRCLEAAPDSKSANILMAGYYLNHGQLDKGFGVFDRLILLYPRDYSICMEAGSYHYNFYHMFDNENMLIKADEMFDRAISINPFCKIEVQQFKSQTDSVYAEQKNN